MNSPDFQSEAVKKAEPTRPRQLSDSLAVCMHATCLACAVSPWVIGRFTYSLWWPMGAAMVLGALTSCWAIAGKRFVFVAWLILFMLMSLVGYFASQIAVGWRH